ncbi:MAG: PAS domain S-box-containing protein [Oleiphilaceae bacterium]|jgi:PAS domain S-box-containing protein
MQKQVLKKQSLEKTIRRQTLPRSLFFVFSLSIMLIVVAAIFVQNQINNRHIGYTEEFITDFNKSLESLQQQVNNLAKNDLIINSIIDDSNRDAYLPVFFRSLQLTVTENVSILFTDFSGKIITGKNIALYQKNLDKFDWKPSVLEAATQYLHYSDHGIMVAAPILYSNSAEGAIVTYVQNLQSAVGHTFDDHLTILVSAEDQVLFSSDQNEATPGSTFKDFDTKNWYIHQKSFGANRVISLEPLTSAYRDMLWLVLFMFIALMAVLTGSLYSTRLSSRMASDMLGKLQRSISAVSNGAGVHTDSLPIENEPKEFETIRKKYDDALRELVRTTISRDKFENVINSLTEVLMVIDSEGNLILCNHSLDHFLNAVGYTLPNDLEKILPFHFIKNSNNETPVIECIYDHVGEAVNVDGQSCEIKWTRNGYLNDHGQVIGAVIIGTNITESKRLESELLIKNKAIDEAQTSIVISDVQQNNYPITYVNKAFETLTGYPAEEVLGYNCRFLQGKETDPSAIEDIRKALSSEQPATITLLNYKKDGTPFFNQLTLNPVFNDKGVVTHILGLQSDVTEQENTARYNQLAKIKAEESAQLKSDFLASMSHEIRTPMNGIMGMLSLLLDGQLNEEQTHHATLAKSSADSLLTIINDILDFSKIEAGKLDIEPIEFNLVSRLGEIVESIAGKAEERGVEVILDTTNIDIQKVVGDPGRIRQILTNLLSNAIKFTDKGNILVRATLEMRANNLHFFCSVKDNGIGIEQDRLPLIFDAFTQADASTTRKFGGTGLGLAICKQLVGLMGGYISVDSSAGSGSTFSFNITLEKTSQPNYTVPQIDIQSIPMLIVDDNKINREVLCSQLKRWGAQVKTAANAIEALAILNEHLIKVAFIDYQMPVTSGDELGKEIRKNEALNGCALILMSSSHNRGDAKYFADIGFNAYFPKPTTTMDLHNALKVVIDGGKVMRQANPLVTSHYIRELDKRSDKPAIEEAVRILLVEDNYTNQVLAEALLNNIGYPVDIVEDGEQALTALNETRETKKYELILMDCQMPIMDGFEATKRIRNGDTSVSYQNIPIIAMTANVIKGDKEKCLNAGMSDYISKPVDPIILQEKLLIWLPSIGAENKSEAKQLTPQSTLTEPLSSWNQEEFLARLNGNAGLLYKVIDAFISDTSSLANKLESAITTQNFEQICYTAHTLKGCCANISANVLANLASNIQLAAKEQSTNKLTTLWTQFDTEKSTLFDLLLAFKARKKT